MARLLLGKHGLQVVPEFPLVYHCPRLSMPDDDKQKDNVMVVPGSGVQKGDLVYHTPYSAKAERCDWKQGFIAEISVVQLLVRLQLVDDEGVGGTCQSHVTRARIDGGMESQLPWPALRGAKRCVNELVFPVGPWLDKQENIVATLQNQHQQLRRQLSACVWRP
jgi:hypothetical protein